MKEQTFAMIKPDGVQRGYIGEVLKRIEQKGLTVSALKMLWVSDEQAKLHYKIHSGKPFYNQLVNFITSGPVVAMVISGENAVELIRILAGATNPTKAQPGTIRGDFSIDIQNNVIHTSDSVEHAIEEISIYFTDQEIINYTKLLDKAALNQFD